MPESVLDHGAVHFSYASDELDAMSDAVNYYNWIVERFQPYLGSRILEVGAGIGTFSDYLLRTAPGASFTLLEPAANNVPRLTDRLGARTNVRVLKAVLGEEIADASADSVVAVNVLEHVPDDADFLAHAHRVLAPGGHLLLFVPAGPGIFGSLDEAFEHYRRYTRVGLGGLVREAGFELLELRYSNLPGVLAWWLSGRILRRRTVTPGSVRLYDRVMIPWLRALERVWTPPRGQSLFMAARRP
jgi:SAM-dependent methyltransferase